MNADPGNGRSAAQRGLLARFHASFCPPPNRGTHIERTRPATPEGFWSMSMTGNVTMRALPPAVPDAVSPYDAEINHVSGRVQFTVFYRLLPMCLTTAQQTRFRRTLGFS